MKRLWILVMLSLSFFMITGCTNTNDTETINQVSLLQGLTLGDYYGSTTIGELKTLGNIGLGTFDGLNWELIMLDGVVYRANDKLEIEVPADNELIPFSNVTFFDNDEEIGVSCTTDKQLDLYSKTLPGQLFGTYNILISSFKLLNASGLELVKSIILFS